MDSLKKPEKDSAGSKKKIFLVLAGVTTGAGAIALAIWAGPEIARNVSFLLGGKGVIATYTEAFHSVQAKVDEIRESEIERDRLRLENANLKLKLEAAKFECQERVAQTTTHDVELKMTHEGGSRLARTLASIEYHPPTHLPAKQVYSLAIQYFKAREDEKAAVILSFLTALDGDDTFKTPRNYLLTGIAWYRLQNFELADQYFDKILKAGKEEGKEESGKFEAQARLWRALVAHRLNRHQQSQEWLRQLVDYHPHSTEAEWVNSTEVEREPAKAD